MEDPARMESPHPTIADNRRVDGRAFVSSGRTMGMVRPSRRRKQTTMNTLSTSQDALGDVASSMGDVVSDGAELAADLVDGLTDVADVAIDTIASTSRVGVRLVGRTFRFIARRPREVLVAVVIVAAVAAVLSYLKSNSADSSAA